MICNDCDTPLKVPVDVELGEIITCGVCGLEFEVKGVNPLNLEELIILGEDWGE